MTSSAGHTGLIFSGSPPSCFTVSRMAAKSTTAGTPLEDEELVREHLHRALLQQAYKHTYVKSCRMTRAGRNGTSTVWV